MKIKIVNDSKHPLPEYKTKHAAGMDLRANIDSDIILTPGKSVLVPIGIFVEIPVGYEAQIRPRSGLALHDGVTVLNAPGTVDADYRGEIGVLLINLSEKNFVIHDGDRIGQMIVTRHEKVEWESVDLLQETDRGIGGFGHTGEK